MVKPMMTTEIETRIHDLNISAYTDDSITPKYQRKIMKLLAKIQLCVIESRNGGKK